MNSAVGHLRAASVQLASFWSDESGPVAIYGHKGILDIYLISAEMTIHCLDKNNKNTPWKCFLENLFINMVIQFSPVNHHCIDKMSELPTPAEQWFGLEIVEKLDFSRHKIFLNTAAKISPLELSTFQRIFKDLKRKGNMSTLKGRRQVHSIITYAGWQASSRCHRPLVDYPKPFFLWFHANKHFAFPSKIFCNILWYVARTHWTTLLYLVTLKGQVSNEFSCC
jgi:hypothetical protein